jgi:hypothetical protein
VADVEAGLAPNKRAPATAKLSLGAALRSALPSSSVLLIIGVLALQLAFIFSYVGAFHAPTPHRITVDISAPGQMGPQLAAEFNSIPGTPLYATAVSDQATARADVQSGSRSAALIVDPTGKTDGLLVASGGGMAVVSAVERVMDQLEASQQRAVSVTDVVPLQSGDARGLSGFYLVIGWLVGGYLVTALLGVTKGSRPASFRRAAIRLLALVPYAIVSGLGGALIVGPLLGALSGHFFALWGLGTLLVLSAATVTMALQALFGVFGIGVTLLLFVVLGNPSAGGAFQPSLLPAFWRALSGALPNGAGTDSVRRIVYFNGHGIAGHLVVIAGYVVAGALIALVVSGLRGRRPVTPVVPVEG